MCAFVGCGFQEFPFFNSKRVNIDRTNRTSSGSLVTSKRVKGC